MRYLPVILILFIVQTFYGQNILRTEYFVNSDPGFGQGISMNTTVDSVVDHSFTLTLDTFPNGLHTLFVRSKDEYGLWSFSQKAVFYKLEAFGVPDIEALEYFIDDDPGFGNGYNLTINSDTIIDVVFNLDLNNLATGLHTLYTRALSDQGNWSHTVKHTFFRLKTFDFPAIVLLEYYIDDDSGFGNAQPLLITGDTAVNLAFNVNLQELKPGIHSLHFRGKDEAGYWGHTMKHTFYRLEIEDIPDIIALEYYIDEDPGFGAGVQVPVYPDDYLDLNFNVEIEDLQTGLHTIYVRSLSDINHWSLSAKQSFIKLVSSSQQKDIVALEYFFDIDPGYGRATDITFIQNDSLDILADVSLSGLTIGEHIFLLRAQDQLGDWGLIYVDTIDVTQSDNIFPAISLTPWDINLQAMDCYSPVSEDFFIVNSGDNDLHFNIDDQIDWLSFSQISGSVPPNDSLMVTAMADPLYLSNSQYAENVHIYSNDLLLPDTMLHIVFDLPQMQKTLHLSDQVLTFPETQVLDTSLRSFAILNTSCSNLTISNITSSSVDFQLDVSSTIIPEGDIAIFNVSFIPQEIKLYMDTIFIYSEAGVDTILIEASSLGVPVISFSVDTLRRNFWTCAGNAVLGFKMYNHGNAPLYWQWANAAELPSWMTVNLQGDTVDVNDSLRLTISIDNPHLSVGNYEYIMSFSTNDTIQPMAELPLLIKVQGNAELAASMDEMRMGIAIANKSVSRTIDLQNLGCQDLIISDISFATNEYSCVLDNIYLMAYQDYSVSVLFLPPSDGIFFDTMTVTSDAGILRIPFSGEGIDTTTCTNVVTSNLPGGDGSLRKAIFCAENGDTLWFDPGLNNQDVLLSTPSIIVSKQLYLQADPSWNIVIQNEDLNNRQVLMEMSKELYIDGIQLVGKSEESLVLKILPGGGIEFSNSNINKVDIQKD